MPDTPSTEEQEKQVAELLARWHHANNILIPCFRYLPHYFVTIVVISLLSEIFHLPTKRFPLIFIIPINVMFVFGLGKYGLARYQFLKSLTDEEKELLERASRIAPKTQRKAVSELLKFYADVQSKDEKHLLRASQQATDDTLLRAAHSTETTPQEQLLRPADKA